MENMKPKIFWKDKPIYIEQLKKWDIEQLKKAISAIGKAEIQMKKNPTVRNDLVIKDLLINICTNITNFSLLFIIIFFCSFRIRSFSFPADSINIKNKTRERIYYC